MTVPATIAPTLGKLIPRLASEHDGEVVATARAIERVLKANGRDWHDLAAIIVQPALPPAPIRSWRSADSDWQRMANFCWVRRFCLSPRDQDFVRSMRSWRDPSEKQKDGWQASMPAYIVRPGDEHPCRAERSGFCQLLRHLRRGSLAFIPHFAAHAGLPTLLWRRQSRQRMAT